MLSSFKTVPFRTHLLNVFPEGAALAVKVTVVPIVDYLVAGNGSVLLFMVVPFCIVIVCETRHHVPFSVGMGDLIDFSGWS